MSQRPHGDDDLLRAALDAAREETQQGLDDIRAQAVYRRIDDGIQAPAPWWQLWRRPLLVGLPLAAAAAAALLLLVVQPPASDTEQAVALAQLPPARIVFRRVDVALQGGQDQAALSEETTRLKGAASFALEREARVDLEVNGTARVAVFGPAKLRRGAGGGFALEQGAAQFSVAKHKPGAPFKVRVGDQEIAVLGTEFYVQVQQGKVVKLGVLEGLVKLLPRVGDDAGGTLFKGGEALQSEGGPVSAAEVADAAAFRAPWWSAGAAPVESSGHLLIESEPAGALVQLAGERIGETPLLVRWAAGDHPLALELDGKQTWQQSAKVVAGRLQRISAQLKDVAKLVEQPRSRPAAKAPDLWKQARALLDARRCKRLDRLVRSLVSKNEGATERARAELLGAECYLRAGKKRRALGKYQRIVGAYGETTSGEAALYETAKLQAELGRLNQGLEGMERYLERYPQGRFAEAASMRRCELLTRFKRLPQARTCLEAYRKQYPGGLRASQAALLLATIAKVEGRWADAAWLYRDFLARAPQSAKAEAAMFNLIQCLRWGKLEGVAEASAEYLKRFPAGPNAEEVRQWQNAPQRDR